MSSDLANTVEKYGADLLRQFKAEMPYKLPKTHPKWDVIARLRTFTLLCRKEGLSTSSDRNLGAFISHAKSFDQWEHSRCPVYCLGLDLMRQFELTNADNLPSLVPSDWEAPLPSLMLIPPANSLVVFPEIGCHVVYILAAAKGRGEVAGFADPGIVVSFMTNTGHPISWYRSLDDWSFDINIEGEGYEEFSPVLKRVISIALQSILSLSYLPELVEDGAEENQGFRPRKAAAEKSNVRYPRWIGKNFTRQKRNPSSNPTPSGITMATHWRRGHWRQQVCGEKWQQRKLQWIQPTLINP
jgi:hypothetical protein